MSAARIVLRQVARSGAPRAVSSIARARALTVVPRAARCLSTSSTRFADPYPLPLSKELEGQLVDPNATAQPTSSDSVLSPNRLPEHEEWPMPEPLDRSGEDEQTLRARLVYQTRKRGMLEGDLILSTFARDQLPGMSKGELQEFDKLLDEPDWDIYYWAIEKKTPPERWAGTELLEKLKVHARNEGKVVRVMPDLSE